MYVCVCVRCASVGVAIFSIPFFSFFSFSHLFSVLNLNKYRMKMNDSDINDIKNTNTDKIKSHLMPFK